MTIQIRFLLAFILAALCVLTAEGTAVSVSPVPFADGSSGADGALRFRTLTTRLALVEALVCPYAPRPTLVLFTPTTSALADAAAETVRNVTESELLPAGVLAAAYRFDFAPDDAAAAAVMDMIAPGQDPRRPFLALYCAIAEAGYGVPGLPMSAFPAFFPRYYLTSPMYQQQQSALRSQSQQQQLQRTEGGGRAPSPLTHGPSLRQWVLSEAATRYVDAVTLALVPAVHSVFTADEVVRLLRDEVQHWGVGREGGVAGVRASRQPTVVVAVHSHLTTQGSAEVMAAWHAAAAQFGGAVLVVATEQPELAARLGLTEFNTARVVATTPAERASLVTAMMAEDGAGDFAPPGPIRAVDTMRAVGDVARALAAQYFGATVSLITADQQQALVEWRGDLQAFASRSPLRKLTRGIELDWAFRTQSVKLLFFLRESDEAHFGQHFKVALEAARRLRQPWTNYKTRTGVSKAFRPPFSLDVYWIDAEHHPAIASALRQSVVPSVVVAVPVLTKEEEAARATAAKQHGGAPPPYLNPDALHGFHTIHRYDLKVVDDDTSAQGAPPSPPTRKTDLEPAFPEDAEELLRFIAGGHFLARVQMAMMPYEARRLWQDSTAADRADERDTRDNHRFLRLDHRYYAPTLAEIEAPRYLHDIFSGELQLPPYAADHSAGSGGKAKADRDEAAAKKKKAEAEAWRRTLEARKQAREERVRAKAAQVAAAREQVKEEIKQEVLKELAKGEGEETADAAPGGGSVNLVVARPKRPQSGEERRSEKAELARRRRKALADITAWRNEAQRIATNFVVVGKGSVVTVYNSLEAPSSTPKA